jgi:hypothetical protein
MTNGLEVRSERPFSGEDRATIRLAAVLLPLGVVLPLLATAIHPHEQDGMDHPAVFAEYAHSGDWIAVHFAQWGAAMLLFAGLFGVYHAIKNGSGLARGLARFGAFATVQAAAGITALQAVDGVALKWATENWVEATPGEERATFAAAEAVRFIEQGLQSYSNILIGLALLLLGAAIAVGRSYPRWLGAIAAGSGLAWMIHGAMVPYVGFFDSTPRLVGMALLVIWGLTMATLMWRTTSSPAVAAPTGASSLRASSAAEQQLASGGANH